MEGDLRPERRRVKRTIHAWKADLPDNLEHIPPGPIAPMGDPVLIEPFQELRIVRLTSSQWETMALVSWGDALYLISYHDLIKRTIKVFTARA
jgi:hypothetical protein